MLQSKVERFTQLLNESAPDIKIETIYDYLKQCGINIEIEEAEETSATLRKKTNAELKEICRARGLAVSGKKDDLIKRILGGVEQPKITSVFTKAETKRMESAKKNVKAAAPKNIARNEYGNYTDESTMLVFNPINGEVIGREINGKVVELTQEDIDACIENKYKYTIPENLDLIYEDVKADSEELISIGGDADIEDEEDLEEED